MIEFRLKELMEERGVSIQQMTRATGISRNTLSNMVNGKTNGIQFENLDLLLDALNCEIGELLKHTPKGVKLKVRFEDNDLFLGIIHLGEEVGSSSRVLYSVHDNVVTLNRKKIIPGIWDRVQSIDSRMIDLMCYAIAQTLIEKGEVNTDKNFVIVYHHPATKGIESVDGKETIVILDDGNIDFKMMEYYSQKIISINLNKKIAFKEGVLTIRFDGEQER